MARSLNDEIEILKQTMQIVDGRCYFLRVYNTWRLLTSEEHDHMEKLYPADDYFTWWRIDWHDYQELINNDELDANDFRTFYKICFQAATRRFEDVQGMAAVGYEDMVK